MKIDLIERAKQIQQALISTKKATINVDTLRSGGLLQPTQSKQFIQWIFDTTPLLQACRNLTMPTKEYIIHGLLMPSRQARKVGINTDGYFGASTQGQMDSEDQGAFARTHSTYTINLSAKELSLPRIISEKVLQQNIEGQAYANTLAQLFAQQLAIDIEDMCINGEIVDPVPGTVAATVTADSAIGAVRVLTGAVNPTTLGFPANSDAGYLYYINGGVVTLMHYSSITDTSGAGTAWGFDISNRTAVVNEDTGIATVDQLIDVSVQPTIRWYKHHLLGAENGWLWRLKNTSGGVPAVNLVDGSTINGGDIHEETFASILHALPKKYKSDTFRSRLRWIMNSDQAEAWRVRLMNRNTAMGDAAITGSIPSPLGIPVLPVAAFPETKIVLTDPANFILGIFQDINIRTTDVGRSAIMKNERYYISRTDVATQVERADAAVLCEGLNNAIV
jgi:hypothetical protein